MSAKLDGWVTRGRVGVYAAMLLAGYVIAFAVWSLTLRDGLDAAGKPFGCDFILFYASAALALKGKAAAAYAASTLLAVEREAVPASRGLFLWCYPPSTQMLIAPVALLPYRAAFAAWSVAGLGLYLALVRRLSRDPLAPLLGLAFPAVFLCVMQGQTGLIFAGLMGLGLLGVDTRARLAGAALGLLAFKPHLAVIVPLVLLASGRRTALAAAAASALSVAAASLLVLGAEPWRAFLAAGPQVAQNLETGRLPWSKAPTVFVALRTLGLPTPAAYAGHVAVAAPVVLATLRAWRREGSLALKAGLAGAAAVIVSPYAFDYDLALLALPLGAAAERLRTAGGPPGARIGLAAGFFAPLALPVIAGWTGVQATPLALLLVFGLLLRLLRPSTTAERFAMQVTVQARGDCADA